MTLLILEHCDRIWVLAEGRTPAEIQNNSQFLEANLGK
jgi:ABC-type branched-subunit amino acid transport system ATPase component